MPTVSFRPMVHAALRADWDALDVAAGLRVGVCVVVPVALGVATGHVAEGMIAAFGGLNVGLAEGIGNYSSRSRTLGAVLVGDAVAVGAGTLAAMAGWWAVPILFVWVLVAAYVGVVGPVFERTGWFAALMFMIGLGLPDPSVANAGKYAALVAVGGVWALVVVVGLWPFHPHRPVLRAVGRSLVAVADVLDLVGRAAPQAEVDRAIARAEELGHEAGAITRWRTVRGAHRPSAVHLRSLAVTSERARTYAVLLAHRARAAENTPDDAALRVAASRLAAALSGVGGVLLKGRDPAVVARDDPRIGQALAVAADIGQSGDGGEEVALLCAVLPALTGAADASWDAPPLAVPPPTPPWVTLRANLTLTSFWARYALRFAIAAAIGLAVARGLGLEKGYWVLITIAVVMKPQLSVSTTSTIHRVIGTVIGAVLGVVVVIAVPGSWGLVVALFLLTVAAISVIRVNYGLGVVFVTPLVLVLLNVAHPGEWEIADARVVNTLLGAAIGLIATVAILTGSERDLVVDRSRIALTRNAAYLRAIGHSQQPERLATRRDARVAADDLLTLIDRAMAEPVPLGGPYLNAATRMAETTVELWEQETELALAVAATAMTSDITCATDAAASALDRAAADLGPSDSPRPEPTTFGDGAAVATAFDATLRSVLDASADLRRASRR